MTPEPERTPEPVDALSGRSILIIIYILSEFVVITYWIVEKYIVIDLIK